jgi:uncharacterized Zn finger protein
MSGATRITSTPTTEESTSGKKRSPRGRKNAEIASDVISRFEQPTWAKAFRLLVEGKVRVTFVVRDLIHATVQGDHAQYFVDYGLSRQDRWTCSCPARVDCSHLRAVQQVTTVRGME